MTHHSKAGADSFTLKVLAILGMTVDHAQYVLCPNASLALQCLCNFAGGFTFLIMAYLLCVGYEHTRSVKRYALRLLAFAALAQAPWWLFVGNDLNVLFTLLLCLGVFYADDCVKDRVTFWIIFAAATAASLICDWGLIGPLVAYLFKCARGGRCQLWVAPVVCAATFGLSSAVTLLATGDLSLLPGIFYALGNALNIPLLQRYNGQRGPSMKYFFYAYYPVHLLVLGLVAKLVL